MYSVHDWVKKDAKYLWCAHVHARVPNVKKVKILQYFIHSIQESNEIMFMHHSPSITHLKEFPQENGTMNIF